MPRRLLLCLACWVCLAACAGGDPPPASGPAGAEPEAPPAQTTMSPLSTESAADDPLAAGRPVTIRLRPTPELAEAVRKAGGGRALRLTLVGLDNPGTGANVRVLVNLPEADASTPLDDPHYVGESAFFPMGADAYGREGSFVFDAGRTLAELPAEGRLTADGGLDVTLVLVPREGPAPEGGDGEISFDGVRLQAVDPES
jgi:hypothetical protein